VVLADAAAGYGGDRRRPVTGGAVRGSRRAVGLASEGRGERLPPHNGETRRLNPGRLWRVTLAALPSRLLASVLTARGQGCQAWRKLADAVGERARAALRKTGIASGTEMARSPGQVP
jgi:hypothetical protein